MRDFYKVWINGEADFVEVEEKGLLKLCELLFGTFEINQGANLEENNERFNDSYS